MSRYSYTARSIQRALAVGTLTGLSGLFAVQAQEQAPAASEQSLQTVVVTGSIIKRSDFETPSPVQVMSAEDLQQSGYTSVSDVLRNLSANGQGTLSQSFPGAFAGGASGVALRGLTVGATLTLIDGERMVAYPLSDDGERSFVDVSSIPMLAVDRVDVLKDGASAEYGSDAMAGVVNVILKKNYTGAEFSAEAGTTQHGDGTTERLTGIFGRGDLASDGYNAYIAVEYRHQDEIFVTARSGTWTTLNWIPYGGTNGTPGAGSSFANLGLGPSAPIASGVYLLPSAGTPFNGAGVKYLDSSCPNAAALAADKCTFLENREEIQPQTGNLNILGRLTKNLAGDWQAVVTGSMFRSLAEQVGAYPTMPAAGTSAGNPMQFPSYGPGFAGATAPLTLSVPSSNPMNGTGAAMYPVGNLYEAGAFNDQFVTNTYRLFVDVRGTALGWDTDLSLGDMYANTGQTYHGLINYAALQTALNNGYVFGSGGPDVAQFSPPVISHMSNSLQVADLRGTRELVTLPGGPLSLGLGVGFNHRYLNATQSPMAASGDYQVINLAFAQGGQTDKNAYAELVAPVVKGLELDGAVRYDDYSPGGGATVPKFGVKWSPIEMLTFRGTYGKGFRAPNPAEAGNAGLAFLQGSFADTLLCPSSKASPIFPQFNLAAVQTTPQKGDVAAFCNFTPVFFNGTNPDLKPEKSTNYTYGFIFSPWKAVSLSVDYWNVKVTNLILTASEFPVLPFPPAPVNNVRTGPVTLPVVGGGSQTFAVGEPIFSETGYVNAGSIQVDGIDFDLSGHWDVGPGRVNASLNWTDMMSWVASSCYGGVCNSIQLAGTHGPSGISGDTGNPKQRGVLSLGWDQGPWNITGTVNYIGSFGVNDPSLGAAGATCKAGILGSFNSGTKFLNGFYPTQYCTVASFTDFDLYSQYAFTKSFTLFGSILNAFNQQPPVDLNSYGQGGGLNYNPAMHQAGAVGRFFNLGVKFTF